MQNEKLVDLHVHTRFSDGTFTPKEVVDYALGIGLSAIAITDHDTTGGIAPALKAANGRDIQIIPGIEFTTEFEDQEVHMLGFFIDYLDSNFIKQLKALLVLREKRMFKMLERLVKKGVNLNIDDVRVVAGEGSVGRLHLAKALFQKGFVASVQQAFNVYIGAGKPCYVKGDRISPIDAINMINKSGGVAVLAHPNTMGDDGFISKFVKAGLKGIEVYHPDHNLAAVNHYKNIAQEYGLIPTGGSDCHGYGKGKILMGTVTMPYEILEKLKNAR